MNLDDPCVFFTDIAGWTVHKLMRFDLDKLNGVQLKVVVLEISSNDLCDFHTKPEKVGSTIITLVEGLWNEFRVDWVVIGQILHQKKQPYPHYNSSVVTLNSWLKENLSEKGSHHIAGTPRAGTTNPWYLCWRWNTFKSTQTGTAAEKLSWGNFTCFKTTPAITLNAIIYKGWHFIFAYLFCYIF